MSTLLSLFDSGRKKLAELIRSLKAPPPKPKKSRPKLSDTCHRMEMIPEDDECNHVRQYEFSETDPSKPVYIPLGCSTPRFVIFKGRCQRLDPKKKRRRNARRHGAPQDKHNSPTEKTGSTSVSVSTSVSTRASSSISTQASTSSSSSSSNSPSTSYSQSPKTKDTGGKGRNRFREWQRKIVSFMKRIKLPNFPTVEMPLFLTQTDQVVLVLIKERKLREAAAARNRT